MEWFTRPALTRFALIFLVAFCYLANTSAAFGDNKYSLQRSGEAGRPDRIVDGRGHLVCSGRWLSAGPEGMWEFYESNGNRVAALTFKSGSLEGPIQLYWGSRVNPAAAGKLQTTGAMHDDRFEGHWVRYSQDGVVMNESVYQAGKLISAHSSSFYQKELPPIESLRKAKQYEDSDRRYLELFLTISKNAR